MSTRAAQAVTSRRAKQELVRVLFGTKYTGLGRDAHRKLDPSIYSFTELRKAYLDRLQTIHPDKLKHQESSPTISTHTQFVELQDAWTKYEHVAKMMQKAGTPEANFTKFGVGCSFSDSPEERAMRDEITDQACRGWFSAGSLSEMTDDETDRKVYQRNVSLCDDSLFEEQTSEAAAVESSSRNTTQSRSTSIPIPSLIPLGFRPKR